MTLLADRSGSLGRVLVLSGGLSHERDVSLRSGRRVADALRGVGVDARPVDTDAALLGSLAADPPDAVVLALHGGPGEDGTLRAVLDLARIPHVGSPAAACRLAYDKPVAREVVRRARVAVAPGLALPHDTFRELGAAALLELVVGRLGLPVMVKPARGGSALGASAVEHVDDLPRAMVACYGYDGVALIEALVRGTEVAVTVVDHGAGPVALPAVEIDVLGGAPYDYAARYTAGVTQFYAPARLPAEVRSAAEAAAVTAHLALGLRDLSRTDLIVTAAGEPVFLETTTSPGLTETSLLPLAVTAAGGELGALFAELVSATVARSRITA